VYTGSTLSGLTQIDQDNGDPNDGCVIPTVSFAAKGGVTYSFAADAPGSVTPFGGTLVATPTAGSVVDDSDPAVSYSGLWGVASSTAFYGGSKHYSTTVGNSALFTFTGTKAAYIASKNTTGGKVAIYIDGVLKTTVNLYSATTQEQSTVYTSPALTSGSHTLKMKLTSGKRINVDAFQVTS
jgi:hypothetical protein